MIRAKAEVVGVEDQNTTVGEKYAEAITLEAVTADTPENAEWAKYTPSLQLTMHIDNPNAWGKLVEGQECYIDLTPIPAAEPESVQCSDKT